MPKSQCDNSKNDRGGVPIVERPAGDLGSERFDLRQFNTALRQNTSLAVIVCNRPHLAQAPICRGTPFAMVGLQGEAAAPGCVGFASLDLERARPPASHHLILRDPAADAAAVADALLGYLETGTPAGDITLGLEYVAASFAP